ncbi:MAG: alpha/beta hydrolase [Frankiales bacterium]|nr:alpha/beta hydrolase [Frankiales bacterium]
MTAIALRSRSRRAPLTGAARVARLSQLPVAAPDVARDPWPGRFERLAGADIFVRATPPVDPGPNQLSGRPAGGGPEPALYVHGLGGASTNFTDLADLLSPWFDGHALDLPGFGQSGPPLGGDYSIAAHARVVVAYLERSGRGPVHLVGNSMGGAISIQVAASRPDLVRTLTLVSPAVPDLRLHNQAMLVIPVLLIPPVGRRALRRLDQTAAENRARATIELCFAHPERVPDKRLAEAVADVTARRQQDWAHDAMLASLRGIVRSYLTPRSRSAWQSLREISVPSLVVWGDQDKLVHVSNAEPVAQSLGDASLLVLPDVGHTAQLEDPVSTARAILGLAERANDGLGPAGVGA